MAEDIIKLFFLSSYSSFWVIWQSFDGNPLSGAIKYVGIGKICTIRQLRYLALSCK